MNRTEEYKTFFLLHPENKETTPKKYKEKFYDTFLTKINLLNNKITNTRNYSQLLSLEQEISSLSKESLISKIELESNDSELTHFEGIKQIINLKIAILLLHLQGKKKKILSYSVELQPEKPTKFISSQPDNQNLVHENYKLKEKYETSLLNVTKQRLKEIDVLQNLIKNTLLEQDERIDEVIKSIKEVKTNFTGSNEFFKNSKFRGRRMKRFLVVMLFCKAFVLLIIHFFNKFN